MSQYLLYNDNSKEITNNICLPQAKICDTETFCIVDPTSTFQIGNTPEITNIINNSAYSPGWLSYTVGNGSTTWYNNKCNRNHERSEFWRCFRINRNANGSNLKLLYNPTSTTDWFINNNNGFTLF
jgi:hypothetical protein